MKRFDYTITNPVGIHARPAGKLSKEARSYTDVTITLTKGEKSADVRKLMSLMGMGVKQGDTVTVSVEGENEEEIAAKIEDFFKACF